METGKIIINAVECLELCSEIFLSPKRGRQLKHQKIQKKCYFIKWVMQKLVVGFFSQAGFKFELIFIASCVSTTFFKKVPCPISWGFSLVHLFSGKTPRFAGKTSSLMLQNNHPSLYIINIAISLILYFRPIYAAFWPKASQSLLTGVSYIFVTALLLYFKKIDFTKEWLHQSVVLLARALRLQL